MSINQFFAKTSIIAILVLALCSGVSFARGGEGHGGGGGGHGGRWGGGHGGGWGGGGWGRGHSYSYAAPSHSYAAPSHAWSSGGYTHAGSGQAYSANRFNYGNNGGWNSGWAGNRGGWAGNRYGNYFGRGGYGGYGGWGWGGYWPWYAGWGLGWGWGYPYADYGYYYPDAGDYYYSYEPSGYVDSGAVVDSNPTAPQQIADASATSPTTGAEDQQGATEALDFYSQARTSFLEGDYHNALRLGGHAAVDAPRNPKVHELISLALFASGNYRAAASEAHAAMALGAIADWKDLYGYYDDVNKYTTQLRALEKAAENNPNDAADRFLLGYHYLMIGGRDNAKTEFAEAVKLTPKDKLAAHYLQELQSNSPLTPPQIPHMATKPQGQAF